MEAHLGDFKFIPEKEDGTPTRLVTSNDIEAILNNEEEISGYTRDYGFALAERKANVIRDLLAETGAYFDIRVVSFGLERPLHPYPEGNLSNIDEWNRVALLNNRVEMKIILDDE